MECGISGSVVWNFYGDLDKNNPPSHGYNHTEESFLFNFSHITSALKSSLRTHRSMVP